MYKNKEIAIKHLNNRKDFSLKIFDNFRDDKEVALAAVSKNGYNIRYCSDKLRDDKEIALTVVSQDGYALQFCSDKFRDDKEVALAAVSNDGWALRHCSERLKDDKEIALVAVSQYGYALEHASPQIQELCKDKDPIKTLESVILHEQLQKEIKPKGLDFAKSLSAECKQATKQATMEQSKPKARMKI